MQAATPLGQRSKLLGRSAQNIRLSRQAAGGGDSSAALLSDREALGAALTAAAEAHAAHIDALEDRLATAAVRNAAALVRVLPSVQAGRVLRCVPVVLQIHSTGPNSAHISCWPQMQGFGSMRSQRSPWRPAGMHATLADCLCQPADGRKTGLRGARPSAAAR